MDKAILSIRNLTVKLKKDKSILLKDINLDLFPGDVLAIDGPNGSGKSTLLKIIIGDVADYIIELGEIVYHPFKEKSIFLFNEKEMLLYRSMIGYVPQRDNYDGLNKINIEDLINDAIEYSKMSKIDSLDLFNKYFMNNEKITLKTVPSKLSGGEQRMISIFLGVVCRKKTQMMIIDEPLNNLDFENAMKVSDLLNEIHLCNLKSCMLMVTHCKIITCINRQRRIEKGIMEKSDSTYDCHHCMGEPDCNNFYLNN